MIGPIPATLTLEGISIPGRKRRYRLPEEADPADLFDLGVDLCRRGRWEAGLDVLERLREPRYRCFAPSGIHLSYLGYGLARRGWIADAIRLCRHAVDRQGNHPDSYLNLTRTLLLAGRRAAAWWSLSRGLSLDPENAELLALRESMGERRPPVISLLSRDSFLNRVLGYLRYRLRKGRQGTG